MAHKISSFQAKTIILSPFYSQKHKDFFKRKTIFGVIGTLKLVCTLNFMSNLLTAFAIAVVHSSRSSSFAA